MSIKKLYREDNIEQAIKDKDKLIETLQLQNREYEIIISKMKRFQFKREYSNDESDDCYVIEDTWDNSSFPETISIDTSDNYSLIARDIAELITDTLNEKYQRL